MRNVSSISCIIFFCYSIFYIVWGSLCKGETISNDKTNILGNLITIFFNYCSTFLLVLSTLNCKVVFWYLYIYIYIYIYIAIYIYRYIYINIYISLCLLFNILSNSRPWRKHEIFDNKSTISCKFKIAINSVLSIFWKW